MRTLALIAGVFVSGCSTISFSPPSVPIQYAGDPNGSQVCKQRGAGTPTTVTRDVHGAWTVIDTFEAAYTCSYDALANGKQVFDLPAFFSTSAAATALALGATPVATIGIIGTAGSSVFNAGKAYYDPGAKADIFMSASNALLCIRKVSVGEVATKVEDAKPAKSPTERGGASADVTFLPEEQYFTMVTTAVFQVRDILASRLKGAGKPLASTIADDLKKAADDANAKQAKADKAGEAVSNPASFQELALYGAQANRDLLIVQARQEELVHLQLDALQPKLDECVSWAKL